MQVESLTNYYVRYDTKKSIFNLNYMQGYWLFLSERVLTSLLTVPKLEPLANTLKEVAESDTLRVTTERGSGLAKTVLVRFHENIYFQTTLHWFAGAPSLLYVNLLEPVGSSLFAPSINELLSNANFILGIE